MVHTNSRHPKHLQPVPSNSNPPVGIYPISPLFRNCTRSVTKQDSNSGLYTSSLRNHPNISKTGSNLSSSSNNVTIKPTCNPPILYLPNHFNKQTLHIIPGPPTQIHMAILNLTLPKPYPTNQPLTSPSPSI
eukprot:TRINITY_DN4778_c2_g1_i1.p2 TRINITY_DN4778_c2_g1~~TRINITY_DN4778_c2_g1_i1.p2  ORF type:complete len:132 (+),score=10.41 TRINITY_DN4778_c2_g1_i1:106-501(+)